MNLTKTNLFIQIFLLICLTFILSTETVYAADIPIFIDNVPAYSEVPPFYQNDTLLVPARLVSEELGATVDWRNEQVSINSDDCQIVLYVGQNQAEVNGTNQNLSAPPQIVQGCLFVPLRFIGENLGADVFYRDNKIFIYSTEFDEKIFAYDKQRDEKGSYKAVNLRYRQFIYKVENGSIIKYDETTGKNIKIPIPDEVYSLQAVSNTGLVYTTNPYSNKRGTFYYNYNNQRSVKLFTEPAWLLYNSNFCKNGCFYFQNYSESKKNIWLVPPKETKIYYAIFSVDIDGTNKKEIFVEEPNYDIVEIKAYNGWIYYVTSIPVIKDYGIDYYNGCLNRIRPDGTNKQQLTDEYLVDYRFTDEGIYYECDYGRGSGLLKYEDLD